MFNEQRKSILQILYEQRFDLPYILDREELAHRIGKHWHEIQPDVAYLEEKGYLITKRSQRGARIFHRPSITDKGVEFVESGMHLPFRKIDVFISSPGDVREERRIVKRVIERCNSLASFTERYVLSQLPYEKRLPEKSGKGPPTTSDRPWCKPGGSN